MTPAAHWGLRNSVPTEACGQCRALEKSRLGRREAVRVSRRLLQSAWTNAARRADCFAETESCAAFAHTAHKPDRFFCDFGDGATGPSPALSKNKKKRRRAWGQCGQKPRTKSFQSSATSRAGFVQAVGTSRRDMHPVSRRRDRDLSPPRHCPQACFAESTPRRRPRATNIFVQPQIVLLFTCRRNDLC